MNGKTDNFEVVIPEREVYTKTSDANEAQRITTMAEAEEAAVKKGYDPSNREYTTVLGDDSTSASITQSDIDEWSVSPQSDKSKTMQIINVIRQYVNKDDIIGITVEAIENNVNAKYRLHWRDARNKELTASDNDRAKIVITEFNEKIKLRELIRESTVSAFRDGTVILYLKTSGKVGGDTDTLVDYVVDRYPVGVAEISQYEVGGEPYVLIDMNTLKSRLRKTYTKTRKGKALFYENEQKEIEAVYPQEVRDAYKQGERYAKLDIRHSGVIRVNNQGKQYGLSSIFRALSPTVMLESFRKADRQAAKVRAKKIIAQYLNKEILGSNYNADTYKQQAYAHETLLQAWKNSIVLVTAPATVREIAYVEPKAELTNAETIQSYRNDVMSTLGISFLMDSSNKSMTSATINIKQLMRNINKITMQLEDVLYKWYRTVLSDAGIDPKYAPRIQVIDAEMMEASLRIELANILFTKLNCSYETAYELLGYGIEDEKMKREAENAGNYNEIFAPRQTAYTTTGDDGGSGGRPQDENSKDPNKQADDKVRNEEK
jgi:hypothetical protein|nr:MAG TPA: Portal protein [Caudoviricetes sp.]